MGVSLENRILSLNERFAEAEERARNLAGAEIFDAEAFNAAAQEAGALNERLQFVNEQIAIMSSGSQFEQMGNSIGDVGKNILSLNFEGASESANRLVAISQNITFTKAIKGVKQLGSTFLQLGKAILANPLFLVIGAIVAIGVAIVKLLKELGLLKVIMEAVGAVFQWIKDLFAALIQPLKDLTDWLGWTANAAEDAAEQEAEAAEKKAKAYEDASKSIVQSLDNQIKMAEITGESTLKLEQERLRILKETAKARAIADQKAFESAKLKGDLDEEELEELQKTAADTKLVFEQTVADIALFNAQVQEERKKAQEKRLADNKKRLDKLRNQQEKANAAAQSAAEKFNANRIAADRKFRDLELANMEDGADKERAIVQEKYKRLLEDTQNNENLLASEKKMLKVELLKAEQVALDKIQADIDAKELAEREEFLKLISDVTTQAAETEIERINEETLAKLEALKAGADAELQQTEEFLAAKAEIERQGQEAIDQFKTERDLEIAQRDMDALLALNETSLQIKLEQLEAERAIDLEQKDLTENELLLIEQEYTERRKELIESEKQARISAAQDANASVAQGLTAVASLSNAIFDAQLSKLEKGSAEEERVAKKKFETNKKLQIAMAIVQGVQATLAAYSSGSAIPVVGAVTGPLFAALAAATSVANIVKIKNSTFQGSGGGSGGSTGSAASGRTAVSSGVSSAAATPSFNLFGSGGDANNVSSTDSVEANQQQTINVNATVSEVEITETQDRVSNIEQNAEL